MTSSHVEISTESRNLPLMPRFYRITAVILRAQSASKADEIIVIPLPTFPTEWITVNSADNDSFLRILSDPLAFLFYRLIR